MILAQNKNNLEDIIIEGGINALDKLEMTGSEKVSEAAARALQKWRNEHGSTIKATFPQS